MISLSTTANCFVPFVRRMGSVTFSWQSLVPVEIVMTVHVDGLPPLTWHMSRALLDTALAHPGTSVGLGSVRVQSPGAGTLRVVAETEQHNEMDFVIEARPVVAWLLETFMVTPRERESVDVDTAISALLDQAQ